MKYEKYLPLGSVIFLKDKNKKIMITGFTAMSSEGNDSIFDYIGCLYPEGFMASDKMVLFNHEDIQKVYCLGYSDEEEEGFRLLLNDISKEMN